MLGAAIAVLYITTLASPQPDAAPARIRLQWSAPPSCPDRDAVAARAERLLLDSDAELTARGEITVLPEGGHALVLSIERTNGTLEHRDRAEGCAVLGELAALLIAVAADPVAVAIAEPLPAIVPEPAKPQPADPLLLDDPSWPANTPATPSSPPPPRRRAIAGWLRASGIVGIATLPVLDAGVALGGAIAIDRWRIELTAAHLFARLRDVPGLDPAQARMSAWLASARGCGELGPPRLRIGACIGPELGAVVAAARRVTDEGSAAGFWAAAVIGPVLRWRPTGRLQLHLGIDAVIALARPSFAVRGDTTRVVAAGPGGLRATLGLAIGLGRAEIVGTRRRR